VQPGVKVHGRPLRPAPLRMHWGSSPYKTSEERILETSKGCVVVHREALPC